jgi:large subunit ribosomal protein L23
MALFSRTKKTTSESEVKNASVSTVTKSRALATDRNLSLVLQAPRITEKSVALGDQNVYTFLVHRSATKYQVRDAVKAQFKVTPVKVNIVNKAPRQFKSRSKGRTILEKGMKKAYVYLKKGDSISLV